MTDPGPFPPEPDIRRKPSPGASRPVKVALVCLLVLFCAFCAFMMVVL